MCNVLWRNGEYGGEPVFLFIHPEAKGRLTLRDTFDLLERLSLSCQLTVRGPPMEQTEGRKQLVTIFPILFELLL